MYGRGVGEKSEERKKIWEFWEELVSSFAWVAAEGELTRRLQGGKVLNDHTTRLETSMIALRPVSEWGTKPSMKCSLSRAPVLPTASHSRHSSSASSSSSSSEVTRRTTSQAQRRKPEPVATSTPRLRTRQVVADLSRELERVRREADRLLFERDEEVCR